MPLFTHQRFPRYRAFNVKAGYRITLIVGSMTFAYVMAFVALLALPAVLSQFNVLKNAFPTWLSQVSVASFIGWITGTFLQIVLVGIIMVGQKVQSDQAEQRMSTTLQSIAEALDLDTEGGLTTLERRILTELEALKPSQAANPSDQPGAD